MVPKTCLTFNDLTSLNLLHSLLFSLLVMVIKYICIYASAFAQIWEIGEMSQTTILDLPSDHVFISGKFCMVHLGVYQRLCSRYRLGTNNFLDQHRLVSSVMWLLFLFVLLMVWRNVWQDIKTEMNPVLNPRAAGPDGSVIGIPGSCCSKSELFSSYWFVYITKMCIAVSVKYQYLILK